MISPIYQKLKWQQGKTTTSTKRKFQRWGWHIFYCVWNQINHHQFVLFLFSFGKSKARQKTSTDIYGKQNARVFLSNAKSNSFYFEMSVFLRTWPPFRLWEHSIHTIVNFWRNNPGKVYGVWTQKSAHFGGKEVKDGITKDIREKKTLMRPSSGTCMMTIM